MADLNNITHKTGLGEPHSSNHGLASGELAIKQVDATHQAAASGKLYYGENTGDLDDLTGTDINVRAFGIGTKADSGTGQSGVPIGGNLYFKEGSNMTITQSVSGDVVELTFAAASGGGGSGDIEGVDISVGTGLDISQSNTTSGSYTSTISLDLSEFADGTADIDSNDEVIYLDNGTEKRKAFSELKLSEFDGNAKASMADSKVYALTYYSDDNTISDAMPSTHLNTDVDGGFFITNPENHEPELNLYRMDTDTKNTNGIAGIKMGNAAHDTDYDGDQPNVFIQTYGGRSSTNHDATISPVTFRFQTTTYNTSSRDFDTRWEMRSVNGDGHGANRGLHAGSFGNIQAYEQASRGGIASTVPTCGSRFIYAHALDVGPVVQGTTNNIDLTSTGMTDLRDGQTFEIFAEVTAQSVGITTAVTVTADWVGAGTSTKTIASGSGTGTYYGYMRCVYIPGGDLGSGQNGWYGIFGAEGVNSGEVTFTG